MKKSKTKDEDLVIFRPDSRNGSKDYYIRREDANRMFRDGTIYGDATNGGYMPSPKTPANFRSLYFVKNVDGSIR